MLGVLPLRNWASCLGLTGADKLLRAKTNKKRVTSCHHISQSRAMERDSFPY